MPTADDALSPIFWNKIYQAQKKLGTGGDRVGVWVVDTGIIHHGIPESLENEIAFLPDQLFDSKIVNHRYKDEYSTAHRKHVRLNFTDIKGAGDPHGTIVASIINEFAPDAHLYDVKAASQWTRSTDDALVNALYNCLAIKDYLRKKRLKEPPMDVINVSMGTFGRGLFGRGSCAGNCTLGSLVTSLFNQGVLVVCAAGNRGSPSIACPACSPQSLSVGGALLRQGKWVHAPFSSEFPYYNKPDILAPAEFGNITHVHLPILTHGHYYTLMGVFAGTSFAAPIVSGVAALLFSKLKKRKVKEVLRAKKVRDALVRTAGPRTLLSPMKAARALDP